MFSRTLRRRSVIAPASLNLMPESSTAIVTSGRPVVMFHAVFASGERSAVESPRTPPSSCGSARTAAFCAMRTGLPFAPQPVSGSGVAAIFHVSQWISSGTVPGARWSA